MEAFLVCLVHRYNSHFLVSFLYHYSPHEIPQTTLEPLGCNVPFQSEQADFLKILMCIHEACQLYKDLAFKILSFAPTPLGGPRV